MLKMAFPSMRGGRSIVLSGQVSQILQMQETLRKAEVQTPEQLVKDVVASIPIFRLSDQILPYNVVDKAERVTLGPGEELQLIDGGPMYIVERGKLQVTIGDGQPAEFGPGQVFNVIGMLGILHEADPFKPTKKTISILDRPKVACGGPYEVFSDDRVFKAPISIYQERRGRNGNVDKIPHGSKVFPEDTNCFFNVCPHAVMKMNPALTTHRLTGWLPLHVKGAPAMGRISTVTNQPSKSSGSQSEEDSDSDDMEVDDLDELPAEAEEHNEEDLVDLCGSLVHRVNRRSFVLQTAQGGASLVAIPLSLIEEVGNPVGDLSEYASRLRSSLAVFKEQAQAFSNVWRALMSRCKDVLYGIPPEVVWNIAEVTERKELDAGEVIVREGDTDSMLLLLEEGAAYVEKAVAEGTHSSSVTIGHLGPNAIIGELCLAGVNIPWAATVRAQTTVELLIIKSAGFQTVMKRWPGMLAGLDYHLVEVGNFLQVRLPLRNEVLSSLDLFRGSEAAFRNEVAGNAHRFLFTNGQVVVDGSRKNTDNLYILELGECCVEDPETKRRVGQVFAHHCFAVGDTLVGKSDHLKRIIRVRSPLAVVLVIRAKELLEALSRHYPHGSPFDQKQFLRSGFSMKYWVRNSEIFSKCSSEFIEDLASRMEIKGYMPGQTLCVKGGQDQSQMFLILGGNIVDESDGNRVASSKTMVGELVMLGATHHRTSTVRAQTFCFTLELSRPAFLKAIQLFPDERAHLEEYALRAIPQNENEVEEVCWPMEAFAPKRLGYLLNLFASRRVYHPTEAKEVQRLAEESAVLVVKGEATLVTSKKSIDEVEILAAGDSHNEQILLGLPGTAASGGGVFVLKSSCELQFVSLDIWDKVISEFPEEQTMVFKAIRDCLVEKVVRKRGFSWTSSDLLRTSPLLRTLSEQSLQAIRKRLISCVIRPEAELVTEGSKDGVMYILLSGTAYVQEGGRRQEYQAVKVFGEAEVLGVSKAYSSTVRASTLCIFQALKMKDLWEVIQDNLDDVALLDDIILQADQSSLESLNDRIQACSLFKKSPHTFVDMLSAHAEDAFFGPGEVVFSCGAPVNRGESEMFILLAGEAAVENQLGVEIGRVKVGEVVGEMAALGWETICSATIRSSSKGCMHCARLRGQSIEAAFRSFPQELAPFEAMIEKRSGINMVFGESRNKWLQEKAIPTLRSTHLFCNNSLQFLDDLAAPLIDRSFDPGEVIAKAADPADSMLVVMDGTVQVEAQNGTSLKTFGPGAAFGEVAALGLFPSRPATIRAVTATTILVVTAAAFQRALSLPHRTTHELEEFEKLIASRKEQVLHGLPMSLLPISISKTDMAARAIALQAWRICLKPGDCLQPLSDDDACGPSFLVIIKGRGLLEMASQDPSLRRFGGLDSSPAVPVTQLIIGSLVLEGMACDYATRIRALSALEICRVRYVDFDVAVDSASSASKEWLPRFHMLETDVRKQLENRGGSARGVVEGLARHPCDTHLYAYGSRRQKAIYRAKKAHTVDKFMLGMTVGISRVSSPTASLYGSLMRESRSTLSREGSAPELTFNRSRFSDASFSSFRPSTSGTPLFSPASSVHLPQIKSPSKGELRFSA